MSAGRGGTHGVRAPTRAGVGAAQPPGSHPASILGAMAGFCGFWLLAAVARLLYSSLPATNPFSIRNHAAVVFFFASLACCVVAAPWIVRPPRRCVGLHDAPRLRGWNPLRLALSPVLCAGLLWAFLATGGGSSFGQIMSAPKLLVPGLVLSAVAEEVFFREALPAALFEYGATRFIRPSRWALAAGGLIVSQGLCALAHLTPSSQLFSGGLASWYAAGWILASNFVFGSLLLVNWWSGARLAERVVIHTCANLAIVLVPTGLIVGIWRSSMFCAVGLLLPAAVFIYRVIQNVVRYEPSTSLPVA